MRAVRALTSRFCGIHRPALAARLAARRRCARDLVRVRRPGLRDRAAAGDAGELRRVSAADGVGAEPRARGCLKMRRRQFYR